MSNLFRYIKKHGLSTYVSIYNSFGKLLNLPKEQFIDVLNKRNLKSLKYAYYIKNEGVRQKIDF